MNTASDWKWLSLLTLEEKSGAVGSLPQTGLYKACAAQANTGLRSAHEERLSREMRELIEIRRTIHSGKLKSARQRLQLLPSVPDPLLEGDRIFLIGMTKHRENRLKDAGQLFAEASRIYRGSPEPHRALRAAINAEICKRDLDNALSGGLAALRQEASRQDCHDLVANIDKAATIELMAGGAFQKALVLAQSTVERYERDGCAEDRAVAQGLLAILHLLSGDPDEAARVRHQIARHDGKIELYLAAYRNLCRGQLPKLPDGHPLANVPWNFQFLKAESVTGKILSRLKQGPASRDELIEWVWGKSAIHPSYVDRLYSAIRQIRKKSGIQVEFNGGVYRVI